MYNFYSKIVVQPPCCTQKLLLIMKLTTLIMITVLMQVSASTVAQKVTLSEKDAPLTTVFNDIRNQTGYDFIVTRSVLDQAKTVTIDVKNAELPVVLEQIFSGQPFDYQLTERSVLVKLREPSLIGKLKTALGVPADINGNVTDSLGQPIAGASVNLKDTRFGAVTDNKGHFTITSVPQGRYQLLITYIGYSRLSTVIENTGQTLNLHYVLHPSTDQLDQVQVIAYGKSTQRFNVGSVSTVGAAEIAQQPVSNVLNALEGRVPGLNVTSTTGAPGSAVQLQIRGQNTLNTTNNTGLSPNPYDQPLLVIDGVPFAPQNQNVNQDYSIATALNVALGNPHSGISPINSINPADIESITVLKDADATSIYGTQGANGVILITTKKGKAGKTTLNLNVYTGYTQATSPVQMMNTLQYNAMRLGAFKNDGLTPSANASDPGFAPDLELFDPGKYTNWFNYFEGGEAKSTNADVSLSGGTAGDTYLISLGSNHSGYNFPGDYADNRLSLHTSFHHQSSDKRLNVEFGTDYAYDRNNNSNNGAVLEAITLPPDYPGLLDAQGNLVWSYKGFDLGSYAGSYNGVGNPLGYLKQTEDLKNYNLMTRLLVSYQLLKGLDISSNFGYSKFDNVESEAQPLLSQDPAQYPYAYAQFNSADYETVDIAPQLNFRKEILKGQLSVLLGGEYKRNISAQTNLTGSGYNNDALLGSIGAADNVYASNDYTLYKYSAIFGRVGYIWNSKYILNVSGRRDGSSNFGPGKQFGNFGSAAAGWIFSEEGLFKKYVPLVSYGKLSGSYGTSGGDGIAPYQYQQNWISNSNENYQGIRPYYATNLFNADYSWSLNKKLNLVLDLGFLKDRILFNATWYRDRDSKQLVLYNLPSQTGFSGVLQNFPATVQNRGWEFSLTTKNIEGKEFRWSSSFNISGNTNKLVAFPGLANSPYNRLYTIGQSVNVQYVWKNAGVNPTTGVFQFTSANGQPTYTPTYLTSTSQLNDEYVKEDPTPKFYGGFSNTFSYRAFSLTLIFQGAKQTGKNYLAGVYVNNPPGVYGVNEPVQLLNVWHKPGDQASLQAYTTNAASQAASTAAYDFANSSGVWGDASYLRLKTLSFSYTLPAALLKKTGFAGASIYVHAQNLFTITGYQVGDPETQTIFGIPVQKTIVAGLNLTL